MYWNIVILLLVKTVLVRCFEENLFCDQRFQVISDLEDKDCYGNDQHLVPVNSENECVRLCKDVVFYPGECEDDCPPGFSCELVGDDTHNCEMDEDSCFKYHTVYKDNEQNALYKDAYWKPECLQNGQWAAKQCKGEAANGRCFCHDELGKRIFGQQFSTKSENMTCACSRDKAKMERDANNWFVSLHCDIEGNYEPLQCNMMDEMCWCADPQTGEVISQIVPSGLWKRLPCYNSANNGDNYMRQCESHLFAQKKLDRILKAHGTMQVNYPHLMCDPDGSYGIIMIESGVAKCAWRDKTVIGSFYSEMVDMDKMDCNCARDSKLLGAEQLQCLASGSYKPAITINGELFCVDKDGFQNTDKPIETASECDNII